MDSEGTGTQYMTVRETAKALGVHENTIRNWVAAGTLRSSRVPGSSAHRFAREEVERLQQNRGAQTSSVAPMLRLEGPELVGAVELDRWAATDDAKGTFPELMSRLLASTPGVTGVDMRSHEGVAAPGWDGTATSTGSSFLPAGELRIELGTNQQPKTKAQLDYDKRAVLLPADANTTFIFATPRNWPTGKAWAKKHEAEKKFRGVRVIDAHTLADWLRSAPPVHYWISERLGYRPRDAQTIERWRTEFADQLTLTLPPPFFLAGRSREAERILDLLTAAAQRTVTIRAPWKQEALAFLHAAAAKNKDLLGRIVIVHDTGAWARLANSDASGILVPLFESPDIRAAMNRGHRVVVVSGVNERLTQLDVDLPKVDPQQAANTIRKTNPGVRDEYRIVALARRSLPALVRLHSRDPRLREPEWAMDQTQSAVLARFMLAGVWTPRTADQELVGRLTGHGPTEVERLLHHLSTKEDSPVIRSGEVWRLTSPIEAGMLLGPKLTPADMTAWNEAAATVLLDPDPYRGMDRSTRLMESMKGITPQYSDALRTGVATGLALAASLEVPFPNGRSGQEWVDRIVHTLLRTAQEDETGATWERLADISPLLAEAAPEIFLDAIETDLSSESPILKMLFQDSQSDFGSPSPHTGILWALEGLSWERALLPRVSDALAMLASIDPGGRLSNRPFESLKNAMSGWVRHSGGMVADKIAFIESMLERSSAIGWKLLIAVWPDSHSVASTPHHPSFRDWVPSNVGVPWTELANFVDSLVELATRYSGVDANRWCDLTQRAGSLPRTHRSRLVAGLRSVIEVQTWAAEERYRLWEAMRTLIERHEGHSTAEWAMPEEDLAGWREIAATIEPVNDARRHSHLFDWRTSIGNLKHGDEGFDDEMRRRQRAAIDEVFVEGVHAIKALTLDVKIPWNVGMLVAERSDQALDRKILAWLNHDEANLRQAALALANRRMTRHGMDWLRTALAWEEMGNEKPSADLMSAVPATKACWPEISALGRRLECAYWSRVDPYAINPEDYEEAVRHLIGCRLAWSAINVLANAVQRKAKPEVDLIKEAFRATESSAGPVADRTMMSYYVETLLTYMETVAPLDPDLPGIEFIFFEFMHDHRPSNALYRALGNNPNEFVELVKLVYRAEGKTKRQLTADEIGRAHIAFSVLREWPSIPGQRHDGTIDAEHLRWWVLGARLALADVGRASVGDEVIGGVLSASPDGPDGIWPAEPIRELVEMIGSARLDTGLQIGLYNRRGITSRGVFDGGQQEREIETTYRDMSVRAGRQWRRTARILRGIADSYRQEARRNDLEAERLADEP